MSFKVVTKVKYVDSDLQTKEWSKEEALESIVPNELNESAGRPVSYQEYKQFMARQAIAPFVGPATEVIALDDKSGLKYFTIRRDDIVSATVEIVKTLDVT